MIVSEAFVMSAKKKTSAVVLAVVSIITVVGVGNYSFENFLNTNTNINQSDSSNSDVSSGDTITNFFGDISEDLVEEAVLASECLKNEIPEEYTIACADWLED